MDGGNHDEIFGVPGLTQPEPLPGGSAGEFRAFHLTRGEWVTVRLVSGGVDEVRRIDRVRRALGGATPHQGIVPLLEVGTTPTGQAYLLAPWYQRGSLKARLDRSGPLPWDQAVALVIELCDTVQFAHDRGVLHGAISPTTVFVNDRGGISLAGLGLPAAAAQVGSAYRAPEVGPDGSGVTPAAEVYSLCALLAALLTGAPPAAGRSGRRRKATDPSQGRAPAPLAEVLGEGLAAEAVSRPGSVADLAERLRWATASLPAPPAATPVAAAVAAAPPPEPAGFATGAPGPPGAPPSQPPRPERNHRRRVPVLVTLAGVGFAAAVLSLVAFAGDSSVQLNDDTIAAGPTDEPTPTVPPTSPDDPTATPGITPTPTPTFGLGDNFTFPSPTATPTDEPTDEPTEDPPDPTSTPRPPTTTPTPQPPTPTPTPTAQPPTPTPTPTPTPQPPTPTPTPTPQPPTPTPTPTPTPQPPTPGDENGDGLVNCIDVDILVATDRWNEATLATVALYWTGPGSLNDCLPG